MASTVDIPDIKLLLSMTEITEQERYVLKYPKWYIVYGKDKKVQRMLRRLTPRLFPAMQEKQVCFVPYFAFNLKTGLGGCMPCHEFLKSKVKKRTRSTASRMSDLQTSFAGLRTLAKHLRNRGCENATHTIAVKTFFMEEEKRDDADADIANGIEQKQISKKMNNMKETIPGHIIARRLRNLFEKILLFCTSYVSVSFAAENLRMSRKHGGEYPELLSGESTIRAGYIKAGALVRHNLFIQIEPDADPIQRIYALTSLQDGHHAGSTKVMLYNDSFWSPSGHKCRAVSGVKPVGASYTADAVLEMAKMVYSAEDYLKRDFDNPMEITNFSGEDTRYIQRVMRDIRALNDNGELKLGINYDRKCAITSASVNDAGSNIVRKVKLDQAIALGFINKCAAEQGRPSFTESQMRSIHCNGH